MNKNKTLNNYAIISGSTRLNSQSRKVTDYISKTLSVRFQDQSDSVQIVDLALEKFPLWEEIVWEKGIEWHPVWSAISKKLQISDAIIVIAPEWNGMSPPQLMNFFQLCSNNELSHKPALIVSISSGQGGAYPIAELRMSSFKNTKICYIPEHVIIRDVNNLLNNFELADSDNDQYVRGRLHHALSVLDLYATTLKSIRENNIVKEFPYPYGM